MSLKDMYGNVGNITGTEWFDPYDGSSRGMFYDAANAPNKGIPGMAYGYTPTENDQYKGYLQSEGEGSWMGNYNAEGQMQGDPYWEENSENWLSRMGPLAPFVLAAGAYGIGNMAGLTGAPISASTPTWTAGLPEAAGAGLEAGLSGVGASTWGAATPALSSAGGSVFDKLSSMFSGDKALNWLPAVANMISQNRQGNYRQDIADRMLNNRQGFVDELQRTYEDPQGYLDSPEYQAIAGTTLNQLMRKDAARGRLANDAERQKLMQDHAFNWLNDRRKTLVQAITGNPFGSDMLQQGTQGLADRYGMFNSFFDMLGLNQGRQAWSFDPQRGYVFDLGKV